MSTGGIWIIDGHNVIYQIGELRSLQDSGRRREARDALVSRCHRFALRRAERKAVVVFDGRDDVSGPKPPNRKNLRVIFAPEAEQADARIVALSSRYAGEGRSVTVVTDDTGLRGRLSRRISIVGVAGFWRRTAPPASVAEEKPRFSAPDIEAKFLEAEPRILNDLKKQKKLPRAGKKKKGG